MTMIVLDAGAERFNYRVAGVAIHDGHVLLHRMPGVGFWALPGGRCEMGESSIDALRRELREELLVDIEIGQLLWVVENFFALNSRRFHELSLYFQVTLPPDCDWLDTNRTYDTVDTAENRIPLVFRWFPLAAIATTNLQPSFLRAALRDLPHVTQHIVHIDADA
jgi:ADP-ribose pyrophosphatase YjhB (NUDIX family)